MFNPPSVTQRQVQVRAQEFKLGVLSGLGSRKRLGFYGFRAPKGLGYRYRAEGSKRSVGSTGLGDGRSLIWGCVLSDIKLALC